MDWLNRLLGRSVSSAEIAKNRLKVVLSYDRSNLTPELLSMLQDEIVGAISRHLDIDRDRMTFSTQHGQTGEHLVADIPIRGVRQTRPLPPPPPPVPAGTVARAQASGHKKKHKKR